ncbi:MAG: type transport system permease protein [Streptomyces sp.]|nr:type transport system permease protein [Streptomyces sp.]
MRRALHAEWTKLASVPEQLWTLAAVTGLMVGVTALVTATQRPCTDPASGCTPPDTTALALSGVYFAQLAALMVAVAVMSAEYHPRLIVVTLAAHPGRTSLLVAKAAVSTAAVLGAGAVGVLGSLLAGRALLDAGGVTAALPDAALATPALTDPALLRAAFGTLLYLALVALLGLGLAAALRHQATAAGAVAALLYGPYLAGKIIPMSDHHLQLVQKLSPMTAGLAVQAAVSGTGTAPIGPWSGLGVLAAYAAAALALGWAALRFRDG